MNATQWLTKFREWVAEQEAGGLSKPEVARLLSYSRPHFLNILHGTDPAPERFRKRVSAVAGIPSEIEEEVTHAA